MQKLWHSLVCTLVLAGCGVRPQAQTKSVDIAQTSVKAQNNIGLCWAYTTVGFLETLLLKKHGVSIALSPEALAFYRMADELYEISTKHSAAELATEELIKKQAFEDLEGWDVTFNTAYHPAWRARNGLQLAQTYGVVPEDAWSLKFTSDEQASAFYTAIFTGFAKLMQQQGQGKVTPEMIYKLLAQPGMYGSQPPTEFSFTLPDGRRRKMSAVDFAADYIGFSPDDYTYLNPDAHIGYSQLVEAAKLTLARGLDVPLSFMIFKKTPNDWDGAFALKGVDFATLEDDGGHAVLITDFVNNGSKPGAVSAAALQKELQKAPAELDFLVLKNSWGTRYHSPLLPLPGYETMDQAYLKALIRKPEDVTIVVPSDIAFQVRYKDAVQ